MPHKSVSTGSLVSTSSLVGSVGGNFLSHGTWTFGSAGNLSSHSTWTFGSAGNRSSIVGVGASSRLGVTTSSASTYGLSKAEVVTSVLYAVRVRIPGSAHSPAIILHWNNMIPHLRMLTEANIVGKGVGVTTLALAFINDTASGILHLGLSKAEIVSTVLDAITVGIIGSAHLPTLLLHRNNVIPHLWMLTEANIVVVFVHVAALTFAFIDDTASGILSLVTSSWALVDAIING